MTNVQIAERKNIYRRLRNLSDDEAKQVLDLIDTFEEHEPNEETAAVLADSEAGRNMSKIYDNVEEMLSDLLKIDNA